VKSSDLLIGWASAAIRTPETVRTGTIAGNRPREWTAGRMAPGKQEKERGEVMTTFKRSKWYWMDDVVNGVQYRLPLKTKNWQEALRKG